MHDLKAIAYQGKKGMVVVVSGMLTNSCMEAKIIDFYPGGNIYYITDPGYAQVFIEERKKPGDDVCLYMLVPWFARVGIPDEYHENVQIFVNEEEQLIVPVQKIEETERGKFVVIALVASAGDKYKGCSIIPENAPYLMIYTKVFGPTSRSECEKWVAENCAAAE